MKIVYQAFIRDTPEQIFRYYQKNEGGVSSTLLFRALKDDSSERMMLCGITHDTMWMSPPELEKDEEPFYIGYKPITEEEWKNVFTEALKQLGEWQA